MAQMQLTIGREEGASYRDRSMREMAVLWRLADSYRVGESPIWQDNCMHYYYNLKLTLWSRWFLGRSLRQRLSKPGGISFKSKVLCLAETCLQKLVFLDIRLLWCQPSRNAWRTYGREKYLALLLRFLITLELMVHWRIMFSKFKKCQVCQKLFLEFVIFNSKF